MDLIKKVERFIITGETVGDQKEGLWFCEDRGQVKGRLPHWFKLLEAWTRDNNQASLISAILGELANNSFDHNLGKWKDTPGCMIGLSIQSKVILLVAADRGQGIISSLGKQLPEKTTPKEVMRVAFEERISGRAPEQRGNGLKFIREEMDGQHHRLFCLSANTIYQKGELSFDLNLKALKKAPGTLSVIEWSLL